MSRVATVTGAVSCGLLAVLEGIDTVSVPNGTPAGFQLPALLQSVSTAPLQIRIPLGVKVQPVLLPPSTLLAAIFLGLIATILAALAPENTQFAASHHNTAGLILHSKDNVLGEFVAGGPNSVHPQLVHFTLTSKRRDLEVRQTS